MSLAIARRSQESTIQLQKYLSIGEVARSAGEGPSPQPSPMERELESWHGTGFARWHNGED
jgi:hypothetical protein